MSSASVPLGDTNHDNSNKDNGTVQPEGSVTEPAAPAREPVFEMVVMGCGGGPLETDCSGYLVKPARSRWEDGVISLEGGSGIGALASHIERLTSDVMFPSVSFPSTHNTPILKAAYIFSHLTCYLITHAHLDHAVSLIMLSGSVPPRPTRAEIQAGSAIKAPKDTRIPVYGMRPTLEKLSAAYAGGLWPELGAWAAEPERGRSGRLRKRRKVDGEPDDDGGVGAMFSPLSETQHHYQLHPSLPISTKVFPLLHGHTSHGNYQSSAVFLRYDPGMLASQPASRAPSVSRSKMSETPGDDLEGNISSDSVHGREFLFFGDVESEYRPEGKELLDVEGGKEAGRLNKAIWKQAAVSFSQGRLAGVFIECSYDASRPQELMFGHVSPPAIFYELKTLVSLLPFASQSRPLAGLRIYVTHIKEFLVPHASGLASRQLVRAQLEELESQHDLGVQFIVPSPGDRLLI